MPSVRGFLSLRTAEADRLKLLAVRYLDDWAYQANIRGELVQQIVYPAGNDGQWLNQLKPRLTREAGDRIRRFCRAVSVADSTRHDHCPVPLEPDV